MVERFEKITWLKGYIVVVSLCINQDMTGKDVEEIHKL